MFAPEAAEKLVQYLASHELAKGTGSEESACSVAAINLALTGELTDRIPDCMSIVIGRWIIVVQDAMPAKIRNSAGWKNLLPLAAGTGRSVAHEEVRLALVSDWMWQCLEDLQPLAESRGFGGQWLQMTETKTAVVAAAAAYAAAHADDADVAAYAARAAYAVAARAAAAADAAARAAARADDADVAAYAAARAARAVAAAYADDAADEFWGNHSPTKLLQKLCEV